METETFYLILAVTGWIAFALSVTSANAEINRLKSIINAQFIRYTSRIIEDE